MKTGLHVSIEGGFIKSLGRAVERGCQTIQIFSSSPRGWYERAVTEEEAKIFREKRLRLKIDPVIVHTKYLINMASQDTFLWNKSVESLRLCLKNAGSLGADFVVTHIGHTEDGYKDLGMQRVASAITTLIENESLEVKLLLENSAGAGNSVGSSFKEIGAIFDLLGFDKNLGICLDTCHAYAAGYDISNRKGLENTLLEINDFIGIDRLKAVHANDSKGFLNSKLDRHQNIGQGKIGLEGFRLIANHPKLKQLPFILETPRMELDDDLKNLSVIRSLEK